VSTRTQNEKKFGQWEELRLDAAVAFVTQPGVALPIGTSGIVDV